MKFAAVASLAVVAAHPEVQGMMDYLPAMPAMPTMPKMGDSTGTGSIKADPKLEADAKWYVEGIKGFYNGYYK